MIMKNISRHSTFSLERRENISSRIGRIIFETAFSVASDTSEQKKKKMPWVEAVDNGIGRVFAATLDTSFVCFHP